jgi:hypothetical protein
MTDPAALAPDPARPPPPKAADVGPALIHRQLAMLGRLAEAGLNVVLAIEKQALAALADEPAAAPEGAAPQTPLQTPPQTPAADLALAYHRASRAVRMTIALQARLLADLQALDERDERYAKAARTEHRQQQAQRKARVEKILERVIEAQVADEVEADRLTQEACERLEDDDIYGELMARPFSEIIDRICKDLGLDPDWSALAQEAWARTEIDDGVAAAPLAEAPAAAAPIIFRWLDPPPDAMADPAAGATAPTPPELHDPCP